MAGDAVSRSGIRRGWAMGPWDAVGPWDAHVEHLKLRLRLVGMLLFGCRGWFGKQLLACLLGKDIVRMLVGCSFG